MAGCMRGLGCSRTLRCCSPALQAASRLTASHALPLGMQDAHSNVLDVTTLLDAGDIQGLANKKLAAAPVANAATLAVSTSALSSRPVNNADGSTYTDKTLDFRGNVGVNGSIQYGGLCTLCGGQHAIGPTPEALQAAVDLQVSITSQFLHCME